MFQPPRRPRPGDTEEDLIREQEEWSRKTGCTGRPVNVPPQEQKPQRPRVSSFQSGTVRERNPLACVPPKPPSKTTSFPDVFEVQEIPSQEDKGENTKPDSGGTGRKKSLFAHMMAAKNTRATNVSTPPLPDSSIAFTGEQFGDASRVLDGSGLQVAGAAGEIHRENIDRMKAMTPKEILDNQAEILRTVDPSILEFLRKKKSNSRKCTMEAQMQVEGEEKGAVKKKSRDSASNGASSKRQKVNFVNMDKLEPEKMEWTKDVPLPSGQFSAGLSARFDFNGKLLASDSGDLPSSSSGLYHHGEEPERPGYTVEELLTLARSTNPQQKALAFSTIAAALRSYKSGELDGCLEQNLTGELLDAGLLILARVGLDDGSAGVREASLYCLRQLLDNQFDEAALDGSYPLELGHVQPSLPTDIVSDPERRAEYAKDRAGLKDEEVVKLDAVAGLLRTDVLQRFAFLLEDEGSGPGLPASSVANMACVLIRIARHSLQSAAEVMRNERLLTALAATFPMHQEDVGATVSILKLCRILGAWSSSNALRLTETFDLKGRISLLLASGFSKVGPSLESLRLWDCLLRRGVADNLFTDHFPLLVQIHAGLLTQLNSSVSNEDNGTDAINLDIASGIVKATGAAVACCSREDSRLEYGHFKDLQRILGDCLAALMRDGDSLSNPEGRKKVFTVLPVAFETYGTMLESSAKVDALTAATTSKDFFTGLLAPFFGSRLMSAVSGRLLSESSFLSGLVDARRRDPSNLPGLGAVAFNSRGSLLPEASFWAVTPRGWSPFGLASSALRLGDVCLRLNRQLGSDSISSWLVGCSEYFTRVSETGGLSLRSSWFCSQEAMFLARAAELSSGKLQGLSRTALLLLQERHRHHAKPLFQALFKEATALGELEERFEHMDLISPAGDPQSRSVQTKDLYLGLLPDVKQRGGEESLTLRNSGELLLPADWDFLPLLETYEMSRFRASKGVDGTGDEEGKEKRTLVLSLLWVAWNLDRRTSVGPREAALLYCRLSTVFLVDWAPYIDPGVGRCLDACFQKLVNVCKGHFDFLAPIPGIDAFRTFFREMQEEYIACSYNNSTFAYAILLPTMSSPHLASLVWGNVANGTISFRLSPSDVPPPLHPGSFVVLPDGSEGGQELVDHMVRAVANGSVNPQSTLLLFEIAAASLKAAASNPLVLRHAEALAKWGISL